MLLRFEVSNHRSIMEPIELSMIAVDRDRPAARDFDTLRERVLTVAGVYGANASGKSNVLDALRWLSAAVRLSLKSWEEAVPREPFRFGNGPESASNFAIEMMVQGVRYEYRLEVNDETILYEGLYSYPKRQRRTLFERDGNDLNIRRGLTGLSGTRALLTPTTLALSAAMRIESASEIRQFGRNVSGIGALGLRRRPSRKRTGSYGWAYGGGPTYGSFLGSTDRIFLDDDLQNAHELSSKHMALGLLRFADLGIDGVEVVKPTDGDSDDRPYLRFMHRSNDEQAAFDLFEESGGTQTWFRLIGPILRALRTGQTILFDEIDSSLHPRLSARLLELFQDPDSNPHNAQLIFTTHDTSLLNHLNRDEVWLTEKGSNGATSLTALAEFGGNKVRRSLNLEKAYLQGRFGAVPELDQYRLRLALGVVDGGGDLGRDVVPGLNRELTAQERALEQAQVDDQDDE
jgi:uncharacterized protein